MWTLCSGLQRSPGQQRHQISATAGAKPKSSPPATNPLKDSDCVFCGECVQACPVGALVEKTSAMQVRPWETNKVRTTCSYCGVGCQLHLHVKDNRVVKVTGVEDVPPNYGSLCVKGRFGYHFINSPERLTTPLIKKTGIPGGHLGRGPGFGRRRLKQIKDTTRTGQPRRADLGPDHQRRKLHRPEICPGGAQNQQHRSLRPALT
jgi:ferredoxin